MRTGYLAADVGRPERLNRAPECWKSLEMPRPGSSHYFEWPDCLYVACNTNHRTGIAIHQIVPQACKPKQKNRP